MPVPGSTAVRLTAANHPDHPNHRGKQYGCGREATGERSATALRVVIVSPPSSSRSRHCCRSAGDRSNYEKLVDPWSSSPDTSAVPVAESGCWATGCVSAGCAVAGCTVIGGAVAGCDVCVVADCNLGAASTDSDRLVLRADRGRAHRVSPVAASELQSASAADAVSRCGVPVCSHRTAGRSPCQRTASEMVDTGDVGTP